MSFHVGNIKLRRYARNILSGLLSCCVIFHVWFLLSQESNDIIMDWIYVASRSVVFATAADAYTVPHVSFYSVSALNWDWRENFCIAHMCHPKLFT